LKYRDSYHLYAMITIILFALTFVLTRMSLRYFSAFSLSFLRFFIASCTLIPMVIFKKMQLPKREDIKWFLASGASGFSLYMIAFNVGSKTVSATTTSVIIATVPVITAIFARVFYKEKLKAFQWAAIAVEFSGVVVITILKGGFSVNIGILWLLAAVALYSVYNLLQRKLTQTYSALQITSYSIFVGTIIMSLFIQQSVQEITTAPPEQILYVLILGVFCGAVAYYTWTTAFEKAVNTSSVTNYMFLAPFLTGVLGIVMAGEAVDSPTIIGGMIIMAGVLIFNFGGKISIRSISEKTSNG